MKTTLLAALCLLSFTACMPCDIEEDETKKTNDMKIKSDSLRIK
ncbi:hypothetical protein [Chryseobacterium lathyri]|uniref:Lipoprotein n=1 Tax=Chryseobacterium lathyri TaxID=395933 RepID=A0ABT9SRB8_9FLAO|nr:hypothetical protein [Chryseobacterium lathyri]MDP9961979.1 hypothetical protein [Chryseobacterium lathyri]MDQ0064202.1 hypothetical protein [Chryseobacterium lathyri]